MIDLRELLENLIRDKAKEVLTAEEIKALCSAYADVCAGYSELRKIESWDEWKTIHVNKEDK